jgi:hypothetical protein
MTVCIGAICDKSSTIVTASDRLVTWGTSSSDVTLKAARLAPTWISMLAGADITTGAEEVIRDVRATLAVYGAAPKLAEVQSAVLGAWRDVKNRIGRSAVLDPFRLEVNEFIRIGRERFGDVKFLELVGELQAKSRLNFELAAFGFDERTIPALLTFDDEGFQDFTRGGYIAIGSGNASAMASLAFHEYKRECSLNAAIYQVCAAKFMAEKADGVGPATMVTCLREDGRTCWLFGVAIDRIRKLWEQRTRPRLPGVTEIDKVIVPIIEELGWRDV